MKISDAELKSVLDGNEEFPINDGGTDKKVTISSIVALIPAGPQGEPGSNGSDGQQGIQGVQGEPGFGFVYDNNAWTPNTDAGNRTSVIASESDLGLLAQTLDLAFIGSSVGTIIANMGRKIKALEAALASAKLPYYPS
jgi:hypothetical protein